MAVAAPRDRTSDCDHRTGGRHRVSGGQLPAIFNAVEIDAARATLACEVQQHLGNNWVRTVAMTTTDGLARGARRTTPARRSACRWPGDARPRVQRPGQPIDEKGPSRRRRATRSIAGAAFEEQTTATEVFETGLKVIDLIAPFAKGGKVGIFGGAGVGKTVIIQELIRNVARSTVATPSSPAWASARARATTCCTR
jgi:F0F1-type ATP synthase beta subunit